MYRILLACLLLGAPVGAAAQAVTVNSDAALSAADRAADGRADPTARGEFRLLADPRLRLYAEPGASTRDTVAGIALDLRVATGARSPALQENGAVRLAARLFDSAALPGTLLLAGALYGAAELRDDDALAQLAMDAGYAIVAAGATSLAAKVIVGRARPYSSPANPYDLGFGRGIRGNRYHSFPSAHTAAAFAMATVLASDRPEHGIVRGSWLGPVAFTSASLAGASRIYLDQHWVTDVLTGAVIGTLLGRHFAN